MATRAWMQRLTLPWLAAAAFGCSGASHEAAPPPASTTTLIVDLRGAQISVAGRPVPDDARSVQRALFTFAPGTALLELRGHVGDDERTFRTVLRELAHGPTPRVRVLLSELRFDFQSRLYSGTGRAQVHGFAHGKAIELHLAGQRLEPLLPGDPASEAKAHEAIQAACGGAHCSAWLSLDDDFPLVSTLSAWQRALGSLSTTLTLRARHDDLPHVPPPVVQHTVRDYFPTLRACYDSGRGRDPNLLGDVIVSFAIASDGKVTRAENDGGNMPDDYVVRCVLRTFETLAFPSAAGGPAIFEYPIAFTPRP
jgi:hypothetical protein